MFCKYCENWLLASKRRVEIGISEGKVTKFRFCQLKKMEVTASTKACGKFTLSKYFWCSRNSNRINVNVCFHRQKMREEGCVRCKQGREVKKLLDK